MKKEEQPRRSYDSTRRQAQARATRRQIVEAARLLFIEHGYAGATIAEIAKEAGVATETVYATFGSKRAILAHLIDVSVVGDDEPVPLLERPGPLAAQHETDQRVQIRQFASSIRAIMTRMAPIFLILRMAAKTESETAAHRDQLLRERYEGMMFFINLIMRNGPLREGLTPEEAGSIVFGLSSGELFDVFTVDRGWSGEQYEKWLSDTLIKLLLP